MIINVLDEFLQNKGVKTAYRFQKDTGLPEATAYRLFKQREVYPDKKSQEVICRVCNAQPGDFLRYIEEENLDLDTKEAIATS